MATLFEHAGGLEGLHRLDATFYASVLKDPLLQPLPGAGQPQHVDHLAAFTAEDCLTPWAW
jgi:hemoglobin